jgi:hypothetical protein
MANEQQGRRSFWGALFVVIGGAFRLSFLGIAAWWRWASQRTTTRGKVPAYGIPIVVVIVIISVASNMCGGGSNRDGGTSPSSVLGTPTLTKSQRAAAALYATQVATPSAPPEIAILQGFCAVFLDAWSGQEWTDCQGVIQNIGQRTLVDIHAGLGFDAFQTQGRTVDANGHVNSSGIEFAYKQGTQQSIAEIGQSELQPGQQLTWHLYFSKNRARARPALTFSEGEGTNNRALVARDDRAP